MSWTAPVEGVGRGILRRGHYGTEVARGLVWIPLSIVNAFAIDGGDGWVLVDAGLYGSARRILQAVEERWGKGTAPRAIVLTHGHFDHVGALEALLRHWDVPIYAHELELPYLTGRSAYAPPEPLSGGGAMAWLSPIYPRGPIDLGSRVRALPADGSIPGMEQWRWIHTPGHTAGHVSLFRPSDRSLVVGDAFVTTRQESVYGALVKPREVHGPPAYYTPDWATARDSVEHLAALNPELAATGHGIPMGGKSLREGLRTLVQGFDRIAIPRHGRYARQPAVAGPSGIVYVPPPVVRPARVAVAVLAAVAVLGAGLWLWSRRSRA